MALLRLLHAPMAPSGTLCRIVWPYLCVGAGEGTCCCFQKPFEVLAYSKEALKDEARKQTVAHHSACECSPPVCANGTMFPYITVAAESANENISIQGFGSVFIYANCIQLQKANVSAWIIYCKQAKVLCNIFGCSRPEFWQDGTEGMTPALAWRHEQVHPSIIPHTSALSGPLLSSHWLIQLAGLSLYCSQLSPLSGLGTFAGAPMTAFHFHQADLAPRLNQRTPTALTFREMMLPAQI
ncbi:hypothetical protein UY3_14401 [Chelonia mydas]|uniref:Uncharacterized protein n=1 Tax=Chelonia mydas TaxID=8469 RepID=M7AZD8_CHEMY|nr:hypothetical protein UY3_14401 [Chelonia mydas]